jgi:hypothetical protein
MACLLAATLLLAVEKEGFKTHAAHKYAAHQSQGDVSVGVKPYRSENDAKEAFGKARPYKYGFLPVLVVITNTSDHAMGLDELKVRFITADREGIEPTPGEDLAYYNPKGHQPKERPPYIPPLPGTGPKARKGPLSGWEMVGREFKAPVVPPRSSVSGFFYYRTGTEPDPIPGSAMYISGIRDLTTGQQLFYFEIPMDAYKGE